jgi:hypothetical protein
MILLHRDGRVTMDERGIWTRAFFMHENEVHFLIYIDESSWFFSALFEERAI